MAKEARLGHRDQAHLFVADFTVSSTAAPLTTAPEPPWRRMPMRKRRGEGFACGDTSDSAPLTAPCNHRDKSAQ